MTRHRGPHAPADGALVVIRAGARALPLPFLEAGETELAVALVRGDRKLHCREWRPTLRAPSRGAAP